jgi:hypothetical protein
MLDGSSGKIRVKKRVSGKKKPSVIEDQVLKDGDGEKNFCGERRW